MKHLIVKFFSWSHHLLLYMHPNIFGYLTNNPILPLIHLKYLTRKSKSAVRKQILFLQVRAFEEVSSLFSFRNSFLAPGSRLQV